LTAVSDRFAEFRERHCDVLAVSTDTIDTHVRWLTTSPSESGIGPLAFPLASDPDGEVCKAYGVFVERGHLALRGLFIIDPLPSGDVASKDTFSLFKLARRAMGNM